MGDAGFFSDSPKPLDVENILKRLTPEEKVALTSGRDFWHTVSVPRLNVPSIRLSDGPNGVRGTRFFDGIPAACLPCGTAIGATFDVDLVQQLGRLLGDEARAKGAHVLLGPTINIQRSPLGGRGFESFSEDPLLSGVLAGHYCRGVQEKDIVPTLKHFVCNDQEHERMACNAIVTDRALREIYLTPFQTAIRMAQPGAIMTAYNKINTLHVSEHKQILQNILRNEWNWKGLVMSDWFGTYSTSEAIQAGLDLEMPGPSRWRGSALSHALSSKKVTITELDSCVRNVLDLVNATLKSGIPENASEQQLNRREDRELLRRAAADSMVLLKNDDHILPLKKGKPVLVIGPTAKIAAICGGGSASLRPYEAVTPFEGIQRQATSQVQFSQGVYGHQLLPELGPLLSTSDGKPGFTMNVYNEPPETPRRRLLEQRRLHTSNLFFIDYSHPEQKETWYLDAEGTFTPERSGTYDFGLSVQGTAVLSIDDEMVVRNIDNQIQGNSFLGSGTIEEIGSKHLEAGKQYQILVQWGCAKTSTLQTPGVVDFGHGGLRFGVCMQYHAQDTIEEAARLAKEAEQVVIFAGLTGEWESEGQDREHMDLPPHTDELIAKVLDANANTVVVIQSGTPVSMPWIDKAKAVLHAWYGGNEIGNGIADVLYGAVNPSAKLPLTIPRRLQDNPAYLNYRSSKGRTLYGEDIYVGYRWYDAVSIEPLFPFGHGLSYTTFELSNLSLGRITKTDTSSNATAPEIETVDVKVKLTNTGPLPGAEVLQLYISPPFTTESQTPRPVRELRGFAKPFLEAGISATVSIPLEVLRATSFWDEERDAWCSERGRYTVSVRTSSRGKFLEAVLEVRETKWWNGL